MLDITKYDSFISLYGGSEVKKTYYIDGKKYMVKFPDPIREIKNNISYVNNQYSEYIGCKIFEIFNIDVPSKYKSNILLTTFAHSSFTINDGLP